MATAKKTTRKSTTKKDLEAKIADLEAKLNKLAAAQDAKPAETAPKPKPAETAPEPKPAETAPEPKPAKLHRNQNQQKTAPMKPKPAETAPKPAEKAPPASGELHERFREIPTETGTHKKLQSLVSLHQVTDTLVVELLSHKLKLHHPTGMIKKQKLLVTQHQVTSTLQQNKDLHIIQKPKNSVLGLMTLLHQKQKNRQKLKKQNLNQKVAVDHTDMMKNQQNLKLHLKKKQTLTKQKMSMLQEWQKKEPLYQKDSSKMLKQTQDTNH